MPRFTSGIGASTASIFKDNSTGTGTFRYGKNPTGANMNRWYFTGVSPAPAANCSNRRRSNCPVWCSSLCRPTVPEIRSHSPAGHVAMNSPPGANASATRRPSSAASSTCSSTASAVTRSNDSAGAIVCGLVTSPWYNRHPDGNSAASINP
jgi:hypothetical protein